MSECSSAVEQHVDVLGCLMQEQMLGMVEVLPLGRISEQIVDFPARQIVEEFSVASRRGGRFSLWRQSYGRKKKKKNRRPSPLGRLLSGRTRYLHLFFIPGVKATTGSVACVAWFHLSSPLCAESRFRCLLTCPLFHCAGRTALTLLFSLPLFAPLDLMFAQRLTACLRSLEEEKFMQLRSLQRAFSQLGGESGKVVRSCYRGRKRSDMLLTRRRRPRSNHSKWSECERKL